MNADDALDVIEDYRIRMAQREQARADHRAWRAAWFYALRNATLGLRDAALLGASWRLSTFWGPRPWSPGCGYPVPGYVTKGDRPDDE